jgi:hypothetical protein
MLASSAALIYFYPEWETANRVSMAEATMRDIRMTVDGVYSSGPGRRETITVRVPTGVDRTQASDGILNMVLDLPGGGVTEVLEATEAPVKGRIPVVDGVHQITVEYMRSGYVVLGGGLLLSPSLIDVKTTAANLTGIVVNVSNAGDEDLPDVELSAGNSTSISFEFNESELNLSRGQTRMVLVLVRTPAGIVPGEYVEYIWAEGGGMFAESQVDIAVGGVVCGDGVIGGLEECEPRGSFLCEREDGPSNGVECNLSSQSYVYYPDGVCISNCTCRFDDPEVRECGFGCVDEEYCFKCHHCFDNVQNCDETMVDSGGEDCQAWEGLECGDETDCRGHTVPGGLCSSFGQSCATKICCTCGGSTYHPEPVYNGSVNMSKASCKEAVETCGSWSSCTGGT